MNYMKKIIIKIINKLIKWISKCPPLFLLLKKIKNFIFRYKILNEKSLRLNQEILSLNELTTTLNGEIEKLKNQLIDFDKKVELSNNNILNLTEKNESSKLSTNEMISEVKENCEESRIKNLELCEKIEQISNKNNQIDYNQKMTDQLVSNEYKNIFYYHGGSGNHGCEALVKTLSEINEFKKEENCLYSYMAHEDYKFNLNEVVKYIRSSTLDASEINNQYFTNDTIAFSIGGDNYCDYDYGTKKLAKYNKTFNDRGAITALIGCSIEPEILNHEEVLRDLDRFSLITARESITYEALIKKGIKNVYFVPDSAFVLEAKELPLPKGFIENETIGINISDLIQTYDKTSNITYDNFVQLIKYIIENTKYQIALIPHVVQPHNNDMESLRKLYYEFQDSNRIVLLDECNCNEIKGYIKRCKMFICSRTHASIAAYSTFVPTLVIGYSVKSHGIAKDIFGTDKNYVLPVQSLKNTDDLLKKFLWLEENYKKIKEHLLNVIPEYSRRCYDLKKMVLDLRKAPLKRKALADENDCTGCGACYSICPTGAIKMKENNEGFLLPSIDYTKCTDCGLCKNVCLLNTNNIIQSKKISYAAINNNEKMRKKSSSGGMFTLLAEEIINRNGAVFGVAYDKNNVVKHTFVEKLEDIEKLMGSKYVQSDLSNSYKKVKEFLEKNKEVLFSGTPCQILGLKNYLGKNYNNLYCVDVVCHGVPSPKVFRKYILGLEEKHKSKIVNIDFRNKDHGWVDFYNCYTFSNKKKLKTTKTDNLFMNAFLKNLSLRKSCYNCQSNNFRSKSDITLGDYWGIEEIHPEIFDDKGCSLIIVNTQKGLDILSKIESKLKLIMTDLNYAISKNPCIIKSVGLNKNRSYFFNRIDEKPISDLIEENIENKK